MAFTKGTANFTNGSKVVTGVSLTSGQLAYFASGTAVFVQSEGQLIEATGLPKDGNGDVIPSQFLLRGNWTGETGSYEFVAFDTIEGLRDAVQSARGFSNQFITLRQEQAALLKLYDSEADGLGSTLDGDYFNVVSANPDIYTALYINDGGTAILIGNMPTAAALNAATQAASESATSASQAAEDAGEYRARAQEWAENPEDTEVETNQFSALHWSAKAQGYSTISAENSTLARKWAEEAENTEVVPGSYSARHWSAKAEAFAASINPTVEATGSTALQRTEDGRGKVADGVEPDDAINLKQFNDKALAEHGVMTGAIMGFSATAAPDGWLKANGAELLRADYPELWAYAQSSGNLVAQASKEVGNFGDGDGSTTFTIPDIRGEFIRGFDDGRGVDSGRSIGSFQSDDNKSHNHEVIDRDTGTYFTRLQGGGGSDSWRLFPEQVSNGYNSRSMTTTLSGEGEARPRNIALLYCIKY